MANNTTPHAAKYQQLVAGRKRGPLNYRESGEAGAFYRWWVETATYVFKVDPAYLWHVPNEGKRKVFAGGRMKGEGMVAGVLDYTLAIPRGGFPGFFFEFKAEGGSAPSDAQAKMLARLAAVGYKTGVYYGARATMDAVEGYMKLETVTKPLPPPPR